MVFSLERTLLNLWNAVGFIKKYFRVEPNEPFKVCVHISGHLCWHGVPLKRSRTLRTSFGSTRKVFLMNPKRIDTFSCVLFNRKNRKSVSPTYPALLESWTFLLSFFRVLQRTWLPEKIKVEQNCYCDKIKPWKDSPMGPLKPPINRSEKYFPKKKLEIVEYWPKWPFSPKNDHHCAWNRLPKNGVFWWNSSPPKSMMLVNCFFKWTKYDLGNIPWPTHDSLVNLHRREMTRNTGEKSRLFWLFSSSSAMFISKNNWLLGRAQFFYGVLLGYNSFICKRN